MGSDINEGDISTAIEYYWRERSSQRETQTDVSHSQGGRRKEVTGGDHMARFEELLREELLKAGLPENAMWFGGQATLPGYYRPSKTWDIVVTQNNHLIAAIELKSQASSFGNNWNNRVEEAIGSATDLRTAVSEGVIETPVEPWLGYVYLMGMAGMEGGESPRTSELGVEEAFIGSSYAGRCETLCLRLKQSGLYDGASFMLSPEEGGRDGTFETPHEALTFQGFAADLIDHVERYLDVHGQRQTRLDEIE